MLSIFKRREFFLFCAAFGRRWNCLYKKVFLFAAFFSGCLRLPSSFLFLLPLFYPFPFIFRLFPFFLVVVPMDGSLNNTLIKIYHPLRWLWAKNKVLGEKIFISYKDGARNWDLCLNYVGKTRFSFLSHPDNLWKSPNDPPKCRPGCCLCQIFILRDVSRTKSTSRDFSDSIRLDCLRGTVNFV